MKSGIPFLLFVLIVSLSYSYAQEITDLEIPCYKQRMNKNCDKGWFTLGLGTDTNELLHVFMRANFGRDFPYQISIASSSGLFGVDQTNYLGVSKGASIIDGIGRFSIFGGPSIIWGNDSHPQPGASFNAQINITPKIPLGLGLDFYGVVSPTYHMFGIGFSIVIEGHK